MLEIVIDGLLLYQRLPLSSDDWLHGATKVHLSAFWAEQVLSGMNGGFLAILQLLCVGMVDGLCEPLHAAVGELGAVKGMIRTSITRCLAITPFQSAN